MRSVRIRTLEAKRSKSKKAGTIVGINASDTTTIFDHSSIPATVEKRFSLQALTLRDEAANTLDIALNLANPRTDTPTSLPDPTNDTI
jgi:hypothetical protein